MAEELPKPGKSLNIRVHKAHSSPKRFNPKISSPRHIILKLSKSKNKERILKAARKKCSQETGNPHKAISRFLSRNSAGQKRVLKENKLSAKNILPGKAVLQK